ncbi:hypothetical protein BY996DRAFT_6415440 [Phakopsora pachyrhizi]|nr:hypothetical protein BY996DRAFT_6415440 [Phakopsora pachyrhizi]
MISFRDGYTSASSGNCLTSNWIPGGWNEADSIQALQETNVAIQKATSKRLSTLVFRKPVSIHLQTALAELSGKEENYTYQHCLASSVNQQQILDKLSALLIEKSSRSPNARISLLTGNGKDDMNSKPFPLQRGRGGRGGRVDSVAAKWAKMAASEKAKLSSVEKSLSKSLRKGNDGSEALKSGVLVWTSGLGCLEHS